MQRERIALPVVQHALERAVAQVLPDQAVRLQGPAAAGEPGGEELFGVAGLKLGWVDLGVHSGAGVEVGQVDAYAPGGTAWRFRHPRHGEFAQAVPAQLHANNAEAFLPAPRAGRGLALMPEFLVWQDLRDGTLETTLDDWMQAPIALHIVTPPGRRRPARVQVLIEYLAERLAGEPWAR